tara:strand:+ start:49 stop:462 length:414 start_codon:yes stop_codon:yes gene_type:complete
MAQSNIEKAFKKLKQQQKKTKKPLVEHYNYSSFTQKDLDFLSDVIINKHHLDAHTKIYNNHKAELLSLLKEKNVVFHNAKYKDKWWEINLTKRRSTKNSLKQFLKDFEKLLDEKTTKLITKFRTTSISDVLSVNPKK